MTTAIMSVNIVSQYIRIPLLAKTKHTMQRDLSAIAEHLVDYRSSDNSVQSYHEQLFVAAATAAAADGRRNALHSATINSCSCSATATAVYGSVLQTLNLNRLCDLSPAAFINIVQRSCDKRVGLRNVIDCLTNCCLILFRLVKTAEVFRSEELAMEAVGTTVHTPGWTIRVRSLLAEFSDFFSEFGTYIAPSYRHDRCER